MRHLTAAALLSRVPQFQFRVMAHEAGSAVLTLTMGLVTGTDASLNAGLRFGVHEAGRAATLLGYRIAVYSAAAVSKLPPVAVVVGDTRCAEAREYTRCLFLDTSYPRYADEDLCGAGRLLHLAPVTPDALWTPVLTAFGAAQLNQRYREFAHQDMNSRSWAAWFAVKAVCETAWRNGVVTGPALYAGLLDAHARYDGHKGRALVFGTDRVLDQPLYAAPPTGRGVVPS